MEDPRRVPYSEFLNPHSTFRNLMIITIDGPSGVGKSTVTKEIAARLGFEYLDTGAMFRAVALAMIRRGVPLDDHAAVSAALGGLHVEQSPGRVLLNGEDVSEAVRTPAVSQGASKVAVVAAVRVFLAAEQRAAASGRDIVCEGRDQGSFVFPDAACKFFLTAAPRVRAERRAAELAAKGQVVSIEAVLAEQAERDARDASRDIAPMRPAPDAILVDTTHLTTVAVIDQISKAVARCRTART